MKGGFGIEKDKLFEAGNADTIWRKYCGFLDLSLEEFMVIQKALLMEQVELVWDTKLGEAITGGVKPQSVDEFRRMVPLTTYEDYEPYLKEKQDNILAENPIIWAHTSGHAGLKKWVPYTRVSVSRLADDTITAFILSAATRKGEVRVRPDARVVLNLPSIPYTTGIMAWATAERLPYQAIPPLEDAEGMVFQERIQQGFKIALGTGVDFAASIAVVLAKVGERFSHLGKNMRLDFQLWHPMALYRVMRAWIRSKLAKRQILPRDIWKVKGLVCGGTDTAVYRDQIYYYWGVQPLDAYVSTETGYIAMEAWNKKSMTFIPYSNFYEFIPEEEWLKSRDDKEYRPDTVLLDGVKPGKTYEIVITNFHGGAFLRYRLGDLVKITGLSDNETGVKLPQMEFVSRADELIDIAGFTRLDEKTIWTAIQNLSIPYEEWCARKEQVEGKPVLHLYLELKTNGWDSGMIERALDKQLIMADRDYRDLRTMTGSEPVLVTLLKQGTFQYYMEEKQSAGFDLAHLKPSHINATDAVIGQLMQINEGNPQRKSKKAGALSMT